MRFQTGHKIKITDLVPYAANFLEQQISASIMFGQEDTVFQELFRLSEEEKAKEATLLATKALNDLRSFEVDCWDVEDIRFFIEDKDNSYLSRLVLWLALRDQPN